jgi:hypothetical protein
MKQLRHTIFYFLFLFIFIFIFYFIFGETLLNPHELWRLFVNTPPMFKTSYLGVSKFGFLSLRPFRTENPNGMPILPLTSKLKLHHFGNGIVLELEVKLAFSVYKG